LAISDHTWVSTSVFSDLPPFAVHAGHDSDGDPIYVGTFEEVIFFEPGFLSSYSFPII